MFKILIIVTKSASFDGGRAVHTQVVDFNTRVEAQAALDSIRRELASFQHGSVTAVALFSENDPVFGKAQPAKEEV